MIKFIRKEFSILDDTLTGAGIGATIGGVIAGKATPTSVPKFIPGSNRYNSLANDGKTTIELKDTNGKPTGTKVIDNGPTASDTQKLIVFGASTLIGAALGAICGTVKSVYKHVHNLDANDRLMANIVKGLEKNSYKEGKDFTRDPKEANNLKTKVCIVLSKNGGEFKALINTVNDRKLKTLTDNITRKLNKSSINIKNSTASNKYNEISISTIPNASSNVKTIVDIASDYIKAGYSTYLVEVG